MIREIDQFYLGNEEPNGSCLLALREIILELDPEISETVKYTLPCFLYKRKMFCYLSVEKKSDQPYILMVDGIRLNHPALEQGDRKRMKILRIDPAKDLPMNIIHEVLHEALDLRLKA